MEQIMWREKNRFNCQRRDSGRKGVKTYFGRFKGETSCSWPINVPCIMPEYVDPGSDGGKYE